mmetsp:Transcript_3699/g.6119  ORF Transcript_3699/g.6119 Transcript_3699/m.6119 type:complete len:103 (-) Transcript_3699:987-1295(-)
MTFCTQSAQLLVTAAKNPMVSNRSSLLEHRISPATTGMSVNMTGEGVCSLRINRANTTVKAGAVALMVSTNDTGTCSRAIRPRTTVSPRRRPTMDMSRANVG